MKKHSIWLISALAIAVLCPFLLLNRVSGQDSVTRLPVSDKAKGVPVQTDDSLAAASENGAPDLSTRTPSSTSAGIASPQAASPLSHSTLSCKYYTDKDFMSSVSAAKSGSAYSGAENPAGTAYHAGTVTGGIVPHHLLAGKMISSFFKTLSESKPETLVVIAPNHRRIGHNSVNTSLLDWSTPFGTVETDSVLTNRLISNISASQNNALMEEEHSISSLVPYIKYYMPGARIVPILLHGNYPADKAAELGRVLSEELSDSGSAAIIASVDFSHYLDAASADKMDEITLAAIKSFDIQRIGMMGNDNLDSPPSILALLSAMKEMGADVPEVTGHDNSSHITGKGADYTTSYYTMLFRRPVHHNQSNPE